MDLVGHGAVNDEENDGGQEGDKTADGHKGHGAEVAEQRERRYDDEVDTSPEKLALSHREVPVVPGKACEQVVEYDLGVKPINETHFIRNQTAAH